MTPATVATLVRWGPSALRDLPWRRTRDPWAILVSELMLQQTQVERVIPKYEAFLARFPDVRSCAAAPPAAVIGLWQGLGYNRRAVNLHRAATAMVEHHRGRVPDRLDALLGLPGIGPYTARAVLAFAYERDDVGVLDTNVARVLARHVAGRPLKPREAQDLADAITPDGLGWLWNQSIMELGALTCRKRAPDCTGCPIAGSCTWHRSGNDGPDPADGSAAVSTPQSRFEGSDRQGRGRLVDALRDGPVPLADAADAAGWPDEPERAGRVVAGLLADGLAEERNGILALPG